MKIALNSILLILVCFLAVVSCKSTITCSTSAETNVVISSSDTNVNIMDTAAWVGRYTPGTNFSVLTDSFADVQLGNITSATGFVYGKAFALSSLKANIYGADWRIILYPSMRSYSITNLSHDNRTVQTKAQEGVFKCYDDMSYTANGVAGTWSAGNETTTTVMIGSISVISVTY